jgi:hypothetical protein
MKTLKKCTNMFGQVSVEYREKLEKYINKQNHTADEWDEVAHIIIDGSGQMKTVWQALIDIDSSFPTSGRTKNEKGKIIKEWAKIPCGFDVARAIQKHFI